MTLVGNSDVFGDVAKEGSDIYFGSGYSTLMRIGADGGEPETLGPGLAGALVVNGGFVYFPDAITGAIARIPKSGRTPTVLAQASAILGASIAVDETCVYYVDLVAQDGDGGCIAAFRRIAK